MKSMTLRRFVVCAVRLIVGRRGLGQLGAVDRAFVDQLVEVDLQRRLGERRGTERRTKTIAR